MDFIAYHKAHEYGPYRLYEEGICYFQSAKRSVLEQSLGNTVFVIQGWRQKPGVPTLYALVRVFRPEGHLTEIDEGQYCIQGPALRIYPIPPVLNEFEWFDRLFQQQRNFSLGFNRLSDAEIAGELRDLPYQEPSIFLD